MERRRDDNAEEFGLKTCPHCHTRLFDDMTFCYECMRELDESRPDSPDQEGSPTNSSEEIPEGDLCEAAVPSEHARRRVLHSEGDPGCEGTAHAGDGICEGNDLFGLFLIELSSFLEQFVSDRIVGVKEPVGVFREGASMCAVTDEEVDP